MIVHLNDVESVQAALDQEWGYATQSGVVTSKFCPVCNAQVPYGGAGAKPGDAVKRHKAYHLGMARLLAGSP